MPKKTEDDLDDDDFHHGAPNYFVEYIFGVIVPAGIVLLVILHYK